MATATSATNGRSGRIVRAPSGWTAVLMTAVGLLLLDSLTTLVAGGSPAAGLAIAVVVAVLTLGFWAGSARLLHRVATAAGFPGDISDCREATGRAYPVLIGFALIDLAQAGLSHAGAVGAASALGWLAVPLLVAFVALTVVALVRVYALPPLTAFSLALLPYAVVSATLLVVGLALSVVSRL